MLFRRASCSWSRLRFFPRASATRTDRAAAAASPLTSLSPIVRAFWSRNSGSSSSKKRNVDLLRGIMLFSQAVFTIGVNSVPVYADNGSVADLVPEKDKEEAYISGLQRIEDGSIVSNAHTVKWRIFTDNGRSLFLNGKLDEAEFFFKSALEEAKEGFGLRDAHVASSCNNLAELYRVKKEFEKAVPLYLDAIEILEESFGPDDVRVGSALHNLGQFYLVQRKLEEARKCYERALKIKGRALGYSHMDYADTMFHLGTVLHLQGKDSDSAALIADSIRILEEGGLGTSATCIRRMRYFSQILLKSNRLSEAENLQRKILHILELSKGWESLDTVSAAENLALTLQSIGSLMEAHELMERCLNTKKSILGQDHIQVAVSMHHLARNSMLRSNQLRKKDLSEVNAWLEQAKFLLDDSLRIARLVLDHLKENKSKHVDWKDEHTALIVLLQSLDAVGLLEVTKFERQRKVQEVDKVAIESELALRECILIFKEPSIRSLLNLPDIKAEYLSCLEHLMRIVNDYIGGSTLQSGESLQELKDHVKDIKSELAVTRKARS